MKDIEAYSALIESAKTILAESVDNADISQKEVIANQTALHSVQSIRSVPNILRNTKAYRNNASDKIDAFFSSSAEDMNTSFELNTSSNESEKESNSNKISSPKLYHQRKQVHNPLDMQYDVPDWNNNKNKNKNILEIADQTNTSHVSPSYEENIPSKKLKYNKQKRSFNQKSRRARKSNSSMKKSCEKLDFDTGLTIPSDININDTVVQNVNFSSDILTESICRFNTSNYINNLNDVEIIQSDELSNISYCDEINSLERKYNVNYNNYNPVISGNSTEFNTMQYKHFQEDITHFNVLTTDDDLKEQLINRDIASDFLFDSKVLYTCTCINCTSCDKDIIFYEDPVSISVNNNTDTEFSTSYIYDTFTNDYQFGDNIFDANWLKEFDKKNISCEEVEETNITKESICVDSNSVTKLSESDASVPSVEQNKLQNLQTCHIDRIQDIYEKSYSAEYVKYSNESTKSLKSIEIAKVFDETDYLNLENISMKEGKVISQDEALIQTAVSIDESVSKSNSQKENKKDLCVIQCTQCGRLFNKKYQFRKHFTRCDFYKEDFKCHICNKMYKHKSSFDQHLRRVHHLSCNPDQKFYICNKCSKSYVRFRAFQRHVLLHDA